jgi:hypothetical protein
MSSPGAATDFDPSRWNIVTSRTFEELQAVVFRAPGRAVTDAHASTLQAVTSDNRPVHDNVAWATFA